LHGVERITVTPIRLNSAHAEQLCQAADDAFFIMDQDEAAKAAVRLDDYGVVIDFSRQFQIRLRMTDGDDVLVEGPEQDLVVPLEQVRYAVRHLAHQAWQRIAKETDK